MAKLTLLFLPFQSLGWKRGRKFSHFLLGFFSILCKKKIFPKFAQPVKILISN